MCFPLKGKRAEALIHYQAALHTAETIEPELQADQLPGLRAKIEAIQTSP